MERIITKTLVDGTGKLTKPWEWKTGKTEENYIITAIFTFINILLQSL